VAARRSASRKERQKIRDAPIAHAEDIGYWVASPYGFSPASPRRLLGLWLLAVLLAGCGGSQGVVGSAGGTPLTVATERARRASSSQDPLIYGFSDGADVGAIYDYQTGKEYGTFDESPLKPNGICSDTRGDVFLTGSTGSSAAVYEYPYGETSPSATVSFAASEVGRCSVDATTGNVAVVAESGPVYVLSNFQGPPKKYFYKRYCTYYMSVGYDAGGNLFLLCDSGLAELRKGQTRFKPISVSGFPNYPMDLQWDGKYLAITGLHYTAKGNAHAVYRFSVSRSHATLIDAVTFADFSGSSAVETWIQPSLGIMVAPHTTLKRYAYLDVWKYPAGGKPVATYYSTLVFGGAAVAVP
jgi:hypothetical protein